MNDQERQLCELLSDRERRIDSLYSIIDAHGNKVPFRMNWAQRHLLHNMHYFNVVLKARQLGFSTFVMIWLLDACLFQDNFSAGVIAHTREDSESLFKNKIKFAYDNLPGWLRGARPSSQDSSKRLEFSNGSSITVGTSLRGGTFQGLHVSEYGKIAARYPEKAREIKTGALNTVHSGQYIFVESTAEGNQGEFYELCQRGMRLRQEGAKLTPMDPKLHFYPWFMNPSYTLDVDVSIDAKTADYFASLPVELRPGQKAWYTKKAEQQGEDMRREFPSTPRESFEQSMEGAIYCQQMALVRKNGQIGKFPHEPSKPVYTFWDLGKGSDYTSIWFFQHIGNEYRFIDYHESWNEGWDFYAKLLGNKPYVYSEHVLPHDGETSTVGKKMSNPKMDLQELGVRPIRIVPRTNDLWGDIKGQCKSTLVRCSFDSDKCSVGIAHLDNYRREWDDRLAQWRDKPRHDEASHGADAFRTFAMGYHGRQHELSGMDEAPIQVDASYDMLDW